MADWTDTTPDELVKSHLARPKNTARSYAADLDTLAEFLGKREGSQLSKAQAVEMLCSRSKGSATRLMRDFVNWLREQYGALNTIRRKSQATMGLLRLAHDYDVIEWMLKPLKLPVPEPVRDTRGPSRLAVESMLDACQKRADAKGARDAAMITLMAYGALRCNETLSLDCRHVSIDAREVEVLSKGLWGRSRHPIPIVAAEAIETWLAFRGVEDGPLFVTLNHADVGDGKRLTYWGAYSAIRKLGKEVGVQVSPHKFRHFAATEHLRLTNGNVAWAMAMTRHRDPKTLMIYNDERMTRAREAMELVASGIPHYRMKA